MQIHTTPILAAAVDTDKLMADAGLTPKTTLVLFAIAIAASVFANWFASFVLAKRHATVGRAALTVLAQIVCAFIFAIALVLVTVFLGAAHAKSELVGLAIVGALLVFIAITVAIPMQIYEIGVLRAIGFLLLSALIAAVVSNIAEGMIVGPIHVDKLPDQFQQLVALVKASGEPASKAPAADRQQRQAALKQRYDQLEIRRKFLPANDHKAFAEYERDRAAYERDVEQFKLDGAQ
jgi:hypothetical protein